MEKDVSNILEIERQLIDEYAEIEKKTTLSNIRSFVNAFRQANSEIADSVKMEKNPNPAYVVGNVAKPIHSTEHMISRAVDVGSLSSVLLFLAKSEDYSAKEISRIVNKINFPPTFLKNIEIEKEKLASKADRLYHDLVETKMS
ncbi:MAG: hypothetical protein LVQ96_01005 [Thermoplasmatales archaeon]|nr:hypothetical protein [Thermoplasmatales archaeon]MCW6169735.1 hypothetical protein [Thermoplasmatales archaeon]